MEGKKNRTTLTEDFISYDVSLATGPYRAILPTEGTLFSERHTAKA